MSDVAVPFALPRWLTAKRIALCAVTLAGAAAGTPASLIPLVMIGLTQASEPHPEGASGLPTVLILAIGIPTAILSAFHALRVGSKATGGLFARSIGWGALLGLQNPALIAAILAIGAIASGEIASLPLLLLGLLFGCVVVALPGGLLGVGFGAVYFLPLRIAARARECPAHDDAERALVFAGVWLFSIGAVVALLPLGTCSQALGVVAGGVGLSGVAAGALARARRRHWLRDVVAGKVAGFAIASGVGVEKSDLED